jgi:NADH-quinone oxidoreductase subunit I
LVPTEFERNDFVFGKDKLVEKVDDRVDVTRRQTQNVIDFKQNKKYSHNK